MEILGVDFQDRTAPAVLLALAIVAAPTLYVVRRVSWARSMRTYTAVPDTARAGEPRRGGLVHGTAVICGGSIAGLLTARVCASHFERVVVVEPEGWTFTDAAQDPPVDEIGEAVKDGLTYNILRHKRSRVYQYSAIHGYQSLLTDVLNALFPGLFPNEAKRFGIHIGPNDPNPLVAGWRFKIPWNSYPGGVLPATILSARRTLEPLIRLLVRRTCPTIEFVHGTMTDFLLADKRSGNQIRAVVLREAGDIGTSREIHCDLVADCTGVAQAGLKMLTRTLPAGSLPDDLREQYGPQMQYASLEFPRVGLDNILRAVSPPDFPPPHHVGIFFSYFPDPSVEHRSLSIIRSDNDGVYILAGGWASEMPVSLDEVREFVDKMVRRSRIPAYVFAFLDALVPHASEAIVTQSRITSCSRIHYARVAKSGKLPQNFVAIGDSSMRMNPRFGEGTTKAALGAMTLDGALRDVSVKSNKFARTFFSRLDARTNSIWEGAKYADYAHPSTTPVPGEKLTDGAFARWFNKTLQPVLSYNPAAAKALWDVSNFLVPASVLFAPSILIAVLREAVFPTRRP